MPKKKKNPPVVFCPNCGVPHSSVARPKAILAKEKSFKFKCKVCGFTAHICREPQKKKKQDLSLKRVVNEASTIKKAANLLGGL